jgi:hypothetical protein
MRTTFSAASKVQNGNDFRQPTQGKDSADKTPNIQVCSSQSFCFPLEFLDIKYEEEEERKVRLGSGRQGKGAGGAGGGESKNHFFSPKERKKEKKTLGGKL